MYKVFTYFALLKIDKEQLELKKFHCKIIIFLKARLLSSGLLPRGGKEN